MRKMDEIKNIIVLCIHNNNIYVSAFPEYVQFQLMWGNCNPVNYCVREIIEIYVFVNISSSCFYRL